MVTLTHYAPTELEIVCSFVVSGLAETIKAKLDHALDQRSTQAHSHRLGRRQLAPVQNHGGSDLKDLRRKLGGSVRESDNLTNNMSDYPRLLL